MARYAHEDRNGEQLAIGLGWFSIALGLAEVAAPGRVARLIGLPEDATTRSTLRGLGAREIANGIAILSEPDNSKWVWARVGGDVMDLSLLGATLQAEDTLLGRTVGAAAALLGVTALDVACARRLGRPDEGDVCPRFTGVRVEEAVTINRPVDEVYQFWRSFQNFPRFMRHLESVDALGDRRSRWRAKSPAGSSVEWYAELIEERENEWIAWRSVDGSCVDNSGSVRFREAPGARGTEVLVRLQYHEPAGAIARGLAWLFGEEPGQQIEEDLRRVKQLMETGEISMSDGPGLTRAAQPAADPDQLGSLAEMRE